MTPADPPKQSKAIKTTGILRQRRGRNKYSDAPSDVPSLFEGGDTAAVRVQLGARVLWQCWADRVCDSPRPVRLASCGEILGEKHGADVASANRQQTWFKPQQLRGWDPLVLTVVDVHARQRDKYRGPHVTAHIHLILRHKGLGIIYAFLNANYTQISKS